MARGVISPQKITDLENFRIQWALISKFRGQYPTNLEISQSVGYWSRNFSISALLISKFLNQYPTEWENFEFSTLLNEKKYRITILAAWLIFTPTLNIDCQVVSPRIYPNFTQNNHQYAVHIWLNIQEVSWLGCIEIVERKG